MNRGLDKHKEQRESLLKTIEVINKEDKKIIQELKDDQREYDNMLDEFRRLK